MERSPSFICLFCYRLRNHVQCSGQSRSSHCHKNLLPHHFRDVQRMEKVMFIQEECTLPWAIPLLRPLKQRVKEFLKNYVQYILYQQINAMLCHSTIKICYFFKMSSLKRLTQNKNQVQAILIKWFQILLSREDA